MSHTADVVCRFIPPGPDRDEVLAVVRVGERFRAHHRGRSPGVLSRHIAAIVDAMECPSFEGVLRELELAALRNEVQGVGPILRVDRQFEIVRYFDGRREREVSFRHIRNLAKVRSKSNRPPSP